MAIKKEDEANKELNKKNLLTKTAPCLAESIALLNKWNYVFPNRICE